MKNYVVINGEIIKWDDSTMKAINVESNIHGEDVMTFEYEGATYKSRVIQK